MQERAALQHRLQEQTETCNRDSLDSVRLSSLVRDLQYDLGNARQSLQVISALPGHLPWLT